MNRLAVGAFVAVAIACGRDPASDFRDASPSRQGIQLDVPTSSGQPLTSSDGLGTSKNALLGQTAELYKATVVITGVINGAVGFVLNLVEEIVKHDPTTVDEHKAVWGPHTAPLSPDTFKFTMTRDGNVFKYVFEGKPKTAPDSAYVAIIGGEHLPTGRLTGQGAFAIDWNAMQALAGKPKEVGTAAIQYQRNAQMDVAIGVAFRQIRDDQTGQRVDADYVYAQAAGGDGGFQFVIGKDFENNSSAPERLAILSRWHVDGAGRGDVVATGGDLGTTVRFSECWSTTFARTFYQDSLGMNPAEGSLAACAFQDASYSSL